MWPAWLIAVVVSVALNGVALLIRPKVKTPKPEAVRDIEAPVAATGRPMYKLFGSMRIKGLNVLDTREKGTRRYDVKV